MDEDDAKDDAEEPGDDYLDERDSEEDDKNSLPTTTISSENEESFEVIQIMGDSEVEIEEPRRGVPPSTGGDLESVDSGSMESLELVEYIAGWEKGNNSKKEEQANQNEITEEVLESEVTRKDPVNIGKRTNHLFL